VAPRNKVAANLGIDALHEMTWCSLYKRRQQSAYSRGRHSVNQEMMGSKPTMRTKIIKRYQNRKLYDTQQSCYVTLDDIAKMIRSSEDVMVIDNKTKNDITAATLTQIIFEAEKKASQYAPLFTLREIIQNGNGSISSFLAKLGAFPQDYAEKQAQAQAESAQQAELASKASYDDVKKSLDERVASAANVANAAKNFEDQSSPNDLPDLPNSNKSLNN
jgi:polyhydroxyalkanoate synthesis repressor PhaR